MKSAPICPNVQRVDFKELRRLSNEGVLHLIIRPLSATHYRAFFKLGCPVLHLPGMAETKPGMLGKFSLLGNFLETHRRIAMAG